MRIPFALWTAVLFLALYGGMLALEYRNFGGFDPLWGRLALLAGLWLGLVILVQLGRMIRKAVTPRPVDLPADVERELQAHPEKP